MQHPMGLDLGEENGDLEILRRNRFEIAEPRLRPSQEYHRILAYSRLHLS